MSASTTIGIIWTSMRRHGLVSGLRLAWILYAAKARNALREYSDPITTISWIAVGATGVWILGSIPGIEPRSGGSIARAAAQAGSGLLLLLVCFCRFFAPQSLFPFVVARSALAFFILLVMSAISYGAWGTLVEVWTADPAYASAVAAAMAIVGFACWTVAHFAFTAIVSKRYRRAAQLASPIPTLGRPFSEAELQRVGLHEAGHALMYGLSDRVPEDLLAMIDKEEVFALGGAVSGSYLEPLELTRTNFQWQLLMLHGGMAAETVFFGEHGAASANDVEAVRNIAAGYLLAGFGPVYRREVQNDFEQRANDEALKVVHEKFLHDAISIVEANRALVEEVAEALVRNECLDYEQMRPYLARMKRDMTTIRVSWPERVLTHPLRT